MYDVLIVLVRKVSKSAQSKKNHRMLDLVKHVLLIYAHRFILVETLFLWRWWNERSEHVREKMKRFLEEGRLQIVGGGWVMSDEATPHYSMLIDQMSLGIRCVLVH